MLLVRTTFHALLLLTAIVIIDTLTKSVAGVQLVLGLVRTGHFFLFAFSAAAALNRQRLVIPLILAAALLIAYPVPMEMLVKILVTTVIGIVAKRKNLDVGGMTVDVRKFMSDDAPRRIKRLELDLRIPLPASHPDRPLLENTARGCPVHHSIHPDIEVAMNWEWLAE